MDHLIPQAWFDDMNLPQLIGVAVVSIIVLVKGADWLVEGAAGLAYSFGVPKVIVGATIVSLGTTCPEAAVSVMGAFAGNSGLALGNAVGSVIADTGLIFGVGCLLTKLPADRFVLLRQGRVQFFSGLVLAAIAYALFWRFGDEAAISRPFGFLFLIALVVYLYQSIKWGRAHAAGEPFQAPEEFEETLLGLEEREAKPVQRNVLRLITSIVVGLLIVLISARTAVCSATVLAEKAGIPDAVLSATLIAFGTSLPELVVAVSSVRKGHPELLVGNVIGADILNVLFVIGAAAVAAPLPIVSPESSSPYVFLVFQLPTMLAVLVLFRIFIARAIRRGSFERWYGWPPVAIYVAFVVLQYALARETA